MQSIWCRITKLKIIPIVLGFIIPGLGHIYQRNPRRGFVVFLVVITAFLTVIWYGNWGWYLVIIGLWLWNIWDVIQQPNGAPVFIAVILWLGMAYGIGGQVTQLNPSILIENASRGGTIIKPMLRPDFLEPKAEAQIGYSDLQVPCSQNPKKADHKTGNIRIWINKDCAVPLEEITVNAEGLWPDSATTLRWITPIGGIFRSYDLTSDANGNISYTFTIPPEVLSEAPDPTLPLEHRLQFEQTRELGGLQLSKNGGFVIQGIYETLALALLATTIGAILAIPFGFLAARNLMSGNVFTFGIYLLTRTLLNIFRSIESLILAIIFVVIVGLGPFPGMIAITIHTIAALGKLFSEVVEGIDPGPIEAIRATGASWVQIVRYAVIPQIIPPFTALTIFRWDINVRSSTIIGFVGGGGIGFYLWQWILLGDYRAVSSTFIAIAVVVIILDFFSARLRERLI